MEIFQHGIVDSIAAGAAGIGQIATTREPVFSGYTCSILDRDGSSISMRSAMVLHVAKAHYSADYFEESDLRHSLRAMLYHLDRVISLYVDVAALFESLHPVVTEGNTGGEAIYFELEAFLSAARRVYESIRKVLWKHYGPPRGSRWTSIRQVLKNPYNIPEHFQEILCESLNNYGFKLADYRDCIAHSDPLNDGYPTCRLRGFGGRWGVENILPSNPECKSRKKYTFVHGPEALTYSYNVACHLVTLSETIAGLEAIGHSLANPRSAAFA
jgi:hypothetical protein